MTALRFRYQTIEFGDLEIHVRSLKNNQQFNDDDGAAEKLGVSSAMWPLFGLLWPSGEVLASIMVDYDIAGKRILEVGCGLGLASLVLNSRDADITATDLHPEAGSFLEENVEINKGEKIPFIRTGWADLNNELGEFDLIIGSDILYERDHATMLSEFINKHAKPKCDVILIDPGRGHHAGFSKKMVALGYSHSQIKVDNPENIEKLKKGQVLRYHR